MKEILPGIVHFERAMSVEARGAIRVGIEALTRVSPFRRYRTSRGRMSIDMTNAGVYGWVADTSGYRYDTDDPLNGKPWPAMPDAWHDLALCFARLAGFAEFSPNACLVNRYQGSAQLGMHVDRDEAREVQHQPIVSVSLGASARFAVGGLDRKDPTVATIMLHDGDVLVMGGPSRMRYHAVRRVYTDGGTQRLNLTFRRAR